MYSNKQNISHIADCMRSSVRQDGCSLSHYYSKLKETFNELDFYQPIVLDLKVL